MGFGDDIARWTRRTERELISVEDRVLSAAYEELEKRLALELPDETPIYTGRLKDSYLFELGPQGLRVSSDLSYARAAVFQTKHDYNAEGMILRVAGDIANDGAFLARVQARALSQG